MDWLGVQFCVIIWVLCISLLQAETPVNKEPACTSGDHIPKPDGCNDCICFRGEVHCTNKPCNRTSRIGPVCDDNQPVYRPDECNECYCFEGRLECSDLVCIRGSKCEEGQVIPKPDSCNMCKCHEGHILCTNHQCPKTTKPNPIDSDNSSVEMEPLSQCEEGDYIPPPPPPDDCNTCLCIKHRVLCTMEACPSDVPEITARFTEQSNNNNYLQSFDKPISVEPFINMFKNGDKTPTKLIHTHAYNGFHQEIKVHTKHLPKDKVTLLYALANTLNNPTLADIGKNIKKTSSKSSYNNPVPLDEENVVSKQSLDSPEIHLTHSSKLITSGSQSNETILIIPDSIDGQNTKAVIPLTPQYETYWDTLSSPAPQIYKNIHQIIPNSSDEDKIVEYYSENPPSFDENKIVCNPAKFGHPGQQSIVKPINPTRYTVEIPDQYAESVIPLNTQPKYINDEKVLYAPFHQDDKQHTSITSAMTTNHYELQPLYPDQLAKPINIYKFNDTSSQPVYGPGQESAIIASDKEDILSQPLQPNLNRFNQPQNEVEPYQKPQVSIVNNKISRDNPIEKIPPDDKIKPKTSEFFLDHHTTSGTVLHISQQKSLQSQVELKPALYGPNKFSPQEQVLYNQDQYKPHTKISMYVETQHIQRHSQFGPNSMYTIDKYKTPEIDVKSNQEQFKPHVPVSYSNSEKYNLPQTALKPDRDKRLPIPHEDGGRNNNTHYETHSKINYVTQYDKIPPVDSKPDNIQITHTAQYGSPYQYHFHPDKDNESDLTMALVYQYLNQLSDNGINSKRWKNKTYQVQPNLFQFNKYYPTSTEGQSQHDKYKPPLIKYPHIEINSKMNTQNQNRFNEHSYIPIDKNIKTRYPQYELPQSYLKPGVFNDHGYLYNTHSDENPKLTKNSQFKPPLAQAKPNDRPNPLVFEHQGSTNRPYGSVEYPTLSKINSYKARPSQFQPIQTRPKSNLFGDRESADVLYISNSGRDSSNTKVNQYKPPYPEYIFPQNHQNPGSFDDRVSSDGFQYTTHSGDDSTNSKVNQYKPPHPQYIFPGFLGEDPTNTNVHQFKPSDPIHFVPQNAESFDGRGSANGVQYTSHSGENPSNKTVTLFKSPQPQHIFPQKQQNPESVDDRASADGYQFIANSTENRTDPQFKQAQDNLKSISVDDAKVPDGIYNTRSVNQSNLFKTKVHDYDPWKLYKPDHDQYKPSFVDSLSKLEDTTKRSRVKPEQDQYKPSSVENLLNRIHEIPWSENTKPTNYSLSPKTLFNPDKSKKNPSVDDFSWFMSKQNETLAIDKNALQPKLDNISNSGMNVIDSNSNKLHSRIKPNKDSSFSVDNFEVPNAGDIWSPILMTVKKYIELTSNDDPEDDYEFAVGAQLNHLPFLPFIYPPNFINVTYEPSSDQNGSKEMDELSEQAIVDEISKIFFKPSQLKLKTPKNIVDNSKSKQIQTTTQYFDTQSTNNYQNSPLNKNVLEQKGNQPLVQYPDVHIILHQPKVDDTGSPEFLNNGLVSQATDINSEALGAHFLQKFSHPRGKYRPKDQKEECGDGTEWISNCHGCSCHDGLAMCFKIPDCNLRPFGDPMICKPYSRFKMGNCYSCECNGDGVAECDASDCKEEDEGKDASKVLELPIYYEFFDEKKTRDLLQYFNFYKKLPKDCPSQTVYPTCEAGTRWVSRCKKCECNENGKHNCTSIEDCVLDYESYGKPNRCKPNSKFYPKSTGMPCVECHCDDEGNPHCPSIDPKINIEANH